jgi:hypothetical protein
VAVKSCKVICCNTEGIDQAVSGSAESLYDAIAQGLKVFRTSEWVSPIAGSTVITVKPFSKTRLGASVNGPGFPPNDLLE